MGARTLTGPGGPASDWKPATNGAPTASRASRAAQRSGWVLEDDLSGGMGGAEERPFAWLTAHRRHEDPTLLVASIVEELGEIEPVDPDMLAALATSDPSVSAEPPFLSRDRGANPRFAQHGQDSGAGGLSQARRVLPRRGGGQGSRRRAPGQGPVPGHLVASGAAMFVGKGVP